MYEPSAVLVTGVQAAGKSTVGRLLAERFEYSAFIEGDDMWRLIVRGRVDMSPDPDPEAIRQFELRLKHGAMLVDSLVDAGFTAVHADLVFEGFLRQYIAWVRSRPLRVIVLAPSVHAVVEREKRRGSNAYGDWITAYGGLEGAVREFHRSLQLTPRVVLWIDSSDQSPEQTVDEIIARWDEALIPADGLL